MSPIKIILTIIPFLWIVGGIPFANKVHPIIFGLPFLAFWISMGIVVSFLCTVTMYRMDHKDDPD